jgi:hypothetical protein
MSYAHAEVAENSKNAAWANLPLRRHLLHPQRISWYKSA